MWYYEKIGHSRCPVVDTWWQTETGGVLITPLPGAHTLKPGSASRPFFGVEPAIVDDSGKEQEGATSGILILKGAWPGIMRTVYGHHQRFKDVYFSMLFLNYFHLHVCRSLPLILRKHRQPLINCMRFECRELVGNIFYRSCYYPLFYGSTIAPFFRGF